MKIGIWVKDKLVWEEEVNEDEVKEIEGNIEVMVSEDGQVWNYINPHSQ